MSLAIISYDQLSTQQSAQLWKGVFDHALKSLQKTLKNHPHSVTFHAEQSFFTRINNGKIRQAGEVEQADLQVEIQEGHKVINTMLQLGRDTSANQELIKNNIEKALEQLVKLAENPYLVKIDELATNGEKSSENILSGQVATIKDMEALLTDIPSCLDLTGLLTTGHIHQASATSNGDSHWFSTTLTSLDFSLYTAKERAIKSSYQATHFDREQCLEKITAAQNELVVMDREKVALKPGQYRCYLAPSAVGEILSILSWHGLSQDAFWRKHCGLQLLGEEKKRLSPLFNLYEDFSLGLAPQFNEFSQLAAKKVPLIEKGQLINFLTSDATANEFGLTSNYASSSESPRSLSLEAGDLAADNALEQLGTGLYISDLHYLNWSDKVKGRITGMSRFGCLWVEEGRVIGPIKDMRFDDTLYNLFGDSLLALSSQAQLQMNTMSYHQRHTGGQKTPGALIAQMNWVL